MPATRAWPKRRGGRCGSGRPTTVRRCFVCRRNGIPNSVTTVLMPDGFSSDALRKTLRERFNVSLGGGLGKLSGLVFRIGHMGDLNEPMLLGALAAVEMALRIEGVPHGRGGVEAAMAFLAEG